MFYAELMDPKTFEIIDKGIFLSIEEFAPYRKQGWSGTRETDKLADELIARAEGR